jgi:Na+-transporting NADH:ubiquinone oxidoreductase subunit NqrB
MEVFPELVSPTMPHFKPIVFVVFDIVEAKLVFSVVK